VEQQTFKEQFNERKVIRIMDITKMPIGEMPEYTTLNGEPKIERINDSVFCIFELMLI